MTSQLYRRLSVFSVLPMYCWVVHACQLPPAIPYDTTLMLFWSTSPLGDRASPPPFCLSVSDLPPARTPSFTAELNRSLYVTIIDNPEKMDFKQTIIDFQKKTIFTSLIYTFKKLKQNHVKYIARVHLVVGFHCHHHDTCTVYGHFGPKTFLDHRHSRLTVSHSAKMSCDLVQ